MTRVALVDDDIEFLDELAEYLGARGFDVSTCHRPGLAWRFVRRERPEALLLDFDMPGVSGLQILERLREISETSSIPVLLLTAHDHPWLRSSAWERRLDDFIPKATDREEIRLRLNRAVERFREQRAHALTLSGLPGGPAARAAFEAALAKGFTASSGEGSARSIFALSFAGIEKLADSDRAELGAAYEFVFYRLANRLRDDLRYATPPGGEPVVTVWQETAGEIFYFPATRESENPRRSGRSMRRPELHRLLTRRIAAANRLLDRLNGGEQYCLAPRGSMLVRRSLPAFRLYECLFAGRETMDVATLRSHIAEDLYDTEAPARFHIRSF